MRKEKTVKKIMRFILTYVLLLSFTYPQATTAYGRERVEYKQAEWAMNTKLGLLFPKIDYASDDMVIFHGYFGLFVYDLKDEKLISSINLESLGCSDLFEKDENHIEVNHDGSTMIIRAEKNGVLYYFDIRNRTLRTVDQDEKDSFLNDFRPFYNFVSSRDIDNNMAETEKYYLSAEAVPFEDGTFGALYMENNDLSGVCYLRENKKIRLFGEADQTITGQSKQSDHYYEAYKTKAGKSKSDFIAVYMEYLNDGDYAGICSISENVDYNEDIQRDWESVEAFVTCKEIRGNGSEAYVEVYMHITDLGRIPLEKEEYVRTLYIKNTQAGWRAEGLCFRPVLLSAS